MKNSILGLLLAMLCVSVSAQHSSKLPISISIFNENIGLPSHRLVQNSIHPGIRVGTEVLQRENGRWQRGLQLSVAGYAHPYFHHAIWLDGQYGIRYSVLDRLSVGASGGLGYLHSFQNKPTYQVTETSFEENGPGLGSPHLMASLGLSLHFALAPASETSPELFLSYQVAAQTLNSSALPVVPHTFFHVGMRFYPF